MTIGPTGQPYFMTIDQPPPYEQSQPGIPPYIASNLNQYYKNLI